MASSLHRALLTPPPTCIICTWNISMTLASHNVMLCYVMVSCLQAACAMAHAAGVPVWVEPVSATKALRGIPALRYITYLSPNAQELLALSRALGTHLSAQNMHSQVSSSLNQSSMQQPQA